MTKVRASKNAQLIGAIEELLTAPTTSEQTRALLSAIVEEGPSAIITRAQLSHAQHTSGLPNRARSTSKRSSEVSGRDTRLKWGKDRQPYEDAPHFAARAYADEITRGTFNKALIRREDKTLYQLLYRDRLWLALEALIRATVLTKSQHRRSRQVKAIQQKIGLGAEEAQRAVAAIYETEPARPRRRREGSKLQP